MVAQNLLSGPPSALPPPANQNQSVENQALQGGAVNNKQQVSNFMNALNRTGSGGNNQFMNTPGQQQQQTYQPIQAGQGQQQSPSTPNQIQQNTFTSGMNSGGFGTGGQVVGGLSMAGTNTPGYYNQGYGAGGTPAGQVTSTLGQNYGGGGGGDTGNPFVPDQNSGSPPPPPITIPIPPPIPQPPPPIPQPPPPPPPPPIPDPPPPPPPPPPTTSVDNLNYNVDPKVYTPPDYTVDYGGTGGTGTTAPWGELPTPTTVNMVNGTDYGTAFQPAPVKSFGRTTVSDENLKTNIEPGDDKLKQFMSSIGAHNYEYKDKQDGPGSYTSPMAQELQKTKLGKQAVIETPRGLMVDYGRLGGVNLAAVSVVHRENQKLQKQMNELRRMFKGKK